MPGFAFYDIMSASEPICLHNWRMANHDTIKRSSKYEQMTVAEAIREYVNETEGLELYEQKPEKGLGILDSYRLK